jgi:NADH-quinone oxidoreductase subunit M
MGNIWHGGSFTETLIFWAFVIAFLVKAPAFPFHTWMPDMYGESPTVVPVVSSVMVKLGTFGLLRFCIPLFPEAIQSQAPILMGLAAAGIVYGGIIAIVQPDMRRLVAYSSISHMGFVMLGLFSLTVAGFSGGAFQQLAHTVVAGALLMLLAFLWERRKTTVLSEYGGLKPQMPIFAALLLIVVLASAGLPGTNGFIGEFLSILGSFEAASTSGLGIAWLYPAAAGFGVVLSAAYLLYLYQRLCYGKPNQPAIRLLRDLKPWEIGVTVCLIGAILWGGIYPSTFLKPMQASLQATRLMAVSPEGQRPVWRDESQSVDTAPGSPTYGSVVTTTPNGLVALAPPALPYEVGGHHRLPRP